MKSFSLKPSAVDIVETSSCVRRTWPGHRQHVPQLRHEKTEGRFVVFIKNPARPKVAPGNHCLSSQSANKVLVDNIFKHFLFAADLFRFAVLEDEDLKILEIGHAGFDLCA